MKPKIKSIAFFILILFGGAALLGVWGYLLYKTEDVDRSAHYDVLANISDLQRLTTELSKDVLLLRLASENVYDELGGTLQQVNDKNKALRSVDVLALYEQKSKQVVARRQAYEALLTKHLALIEKFKTSNGIFSNSINYLPDSIRELLAASTDQQNKELEVLRLVANQLLARTLEYSMDSTPENSARVQQSIQSIAGLAKKSKDEDIEFQVDIAISHAESILTYKAQLDEILRAIPASDAVNALEDLAVAFTLLQENRLAVVDQYRKALVGFSALLLLLVGFIGMRLRRSYSRLRVANETLEEKVAARTQELSAAFDRLKTSQAQLVQSEKMAALGQMVAGVAHEINTPLGYVKSNVELLQDIFEQSQPFVADSAKLTNMLISDEVKEEDLQQQIQLLAAQCDDFGEDGLFNEIGAIIKDMTFGLETINELVLGLKDFSRMDQTTTGDVNLNDCLDSTLLIAKNEIKHSVEIKKIYGKIPNIVCAPSQINQVFLNIIKNAAHAMDEKPKGEMGVVSLTTRVEEAEQFVVVEIADNGKGIPDDLHKKIFDPFFTTKPVGEGTGLGLSISFKIIEEHKGSITVSSVTGSGTTFTISLPM